MVIIFDIFLLFFFFAKLSHFHNIRGATISKFELNREDFTVKSSREHIVFHNFQQTIRYL